MFWLYMLYFVSGIIMNIYSCAIEEDVTIKILILLIIMAALTGPIVGLILVNEKLIKNLQTKKSNILNYVVMPKINR